MRFMIGDVEVFFPYKYIYKEQHEYMKELYVRACAPRPCCAVARMRAVPLLAPIVDAMLQAAAPVDLPFVHPHACARQVPLLLLCACPVPPQLSACVAQTHALLLPLRRTSMRP